MDRRTKAILDGRMAVDEEMYIRTIQVIAETEGWKTADYANKGALERKFITTGTYSKAAKVIVEEYWKQCEEE